jgi:hypothetical protein
VSVGGQTFNVDSGGATSGATSIKLAKNQSADVAIPAGSFLSVRSSNQFWDSNGVGCSGKFTASPTGSSTNNLSGTWSVELTAVRWEPDGISNCSGPATPTCYLRESAPSMCQTVTLTASSVIKVSITAADPGAQDFNVYLSQNGSAPALPTRPAPGRKPERHYQQQHVPGRLANRPALTPDGEGMPLATGLPNATPPSFPAARRPCHREPLCRYDHWQRCSLSHFVDAGGGRLLHPEWRLSRPAR